MTSPDLTSPEDDRFTIDDHLPPDFADRALRADVRAGLGAPSKTLPPKWFYDKHGSDLFEQITRLPEYFPFRAETEILAARASEIAVACAARTVIELGSGSSEKTRLLLDALRRAGTLRRYVPVDVSASALTDAAAGLAADYPDLTVHGLVADFDSHLQVLPVDAGPRLILFLGGTIGNLEPAGRARFLSGLRATMAPTDALLLGAGQVCPAEVVVPAYDDAAGVTARFNRNVLTVLNRELGADFDPGRFTHRAVWDPDREWIEMRLRSAGAQAVRIAALDMTVHFDDGEEVRTEISAKFRRDGLAAECHAAGLRLRNWWPDTAGRYAVSLCSPAP